MYLRNNKIKIIILCICILLVNLNSVNSNINSNFDKQNLDLSNKNYFSDITIVNVSDGFGLDIVIKNSGDADVENILLQVNLENSSLIIPKKQYAIPFLSAGDSTSIHLTIFGFNIGVMRNHSKIILIIKTEDIVFIEGQITFNIIGPFISIISNYFNDRNYNGLNDGYILYCPVWSTTTYIINNRGEVVHKWNNSIYQDSQSTYLLENGYLVRTSLVASSSFISGGYQGRIEIFDWNDTRVRNFEYSTSNYCSHHDIQPLPNGNILIISWERFTKNDAIEAGMNTSKIDRDYIWSDYIIEVQPLDNSDGVIVWEWHAWDHLIQDYNFNKENYGIVSEHPELIDINFGDGLLDIDWLHTNSIDYNPELDQILLSILNFNEIWIIDHSTTTEEAASHYGGNSGKGGDILYRWGNPQSYREGTENDKKFFGQHGAAWVKPDYPGEGNIIVFNSGMGRSEKYSSIDEIIPPINNSGFYERIKYKAYKPEEQTWIYKNSGNRNMNSPITSNVIRLPNGNTLICSSIHGYFLEVTNEKEIVWEYMNPYPSGFFNKGVSRIQWYPAEYPGLKYLNL